VHRLTWKNFILATGLAALSACGDAPGTEEWGQTVGSELTASSQQPNPVKSPALPSRSTGKFLRSANAVPGQYIVVLKDSALGTAKVPELARALALPQRAIVTMTYEHALRGFVVQTSEEGARALAGRPEVDSVEEDTQLFIDDPRPSVIPKGENGKTVVRGKQTNAPWGLDRIDQINLPLSTTYSFPATGAGVHAYIIDSGILAAHPDFGGRASADYTAINDGNGATDCNGHGTFVAGIIGGSAYGVAKSVRLHGVRVANCAGALTISSIIAGVNWVTANGTKPAVVNMSLVSNVSDSSLIDTAVRNSIASGFTYVAAAGNANVDACNYAPARVAEAITVGSTDSTDTRAADSNYGRCVDVFAPGVNVSSTYAVNGNPAYATASGTSFASPHVAGVAALYLETHPSAAPSTVATGVVYASPVGKVNNPGSGSPTRLLHSTPLAACGVLNSGDALTPGQFLYSCNGKAMLYHQNDGNVVVYQNGVPLWNTQTGGGTVTSSFIMQTDGNLVLYTGAGSPLWSTNTGNRSGAYLLMQDDCNLVLYSTSGTPLWTTYTACR
jgi:subtilisin family serine protease